MLLIIFALLLLSDSVFSIEETVCDGGIFNITCLGFLKIHIDSAEYGRKSSKICPKDGFVQNTNCTTPNATDILRKKCEGENNCTFSNFISVFNNPCCGTFKYIQANYSCVSILGPGPVIIGPECGIDEEPGCVNPCNRVCYPPKVCPDICGIGCICKKGLLKNKKTRKCVLPKDCDSSKNT